MFKRSLTLVLIAILMTVLSAAPAWAAPGKPIMPRGGCYWNGAFYPEGSIRVVHYPAYDDYYRCQVGTWMYFGSSDDIN
jgi:hypothetical protein